MTEVQRMRIINRKVLELQHRLRRFRSTILLLHHPAKSWTTNISPLEISNSLNRFLLISRSNRLSLRNSTCLSSILSKLIFWSRCSSRTLRHLFNQTKSRFMLTITTTLWIRSVCKSWLRATKSCRAILRRWWLLSIIKCKPTHQVTTYIRIVRQNKSICKFICFCPFSKVLNWKITILIKLFRIRPLIKMCMARVRDPVKLVGVW